MLPRKTATAVENLNAAIKKILTEYADNLDANIGTIAVEMGQKGAQALRAKSRETFPVDRTRKTSGKYASGWTYTSEKTRMSTVVTIYNKYPSLPHLLEFGHVTRNGTNRTFPKTPAHEHIKPVVDEIIPAFEKEVQGKI